MSFSFKNLKIGTRLGLGFGALGIFLLTLALVGLMNMRGIMDNLRGITEVNNREVGLANQMVDESRDIGTLIRNIILVSDEASLKAEVQHLNESRERYETAYEALSKMFQDNKETSDLELAHLKKIAELRAAYRDVSSPVIELALQGKDAEATMLLLSKAAPAGAAWRDAINELLMLEDKITAEATQAAVAAYESARALMIGLTLAALALALLGAIIITRGITRPIARAVAVADAIASNRLDNVINVDSSDETGQLLGKLKTMQQNLLDRMTAEAQVAAESLRVRTALDNSTVNAMIADNDGVIVYANRAVLAMLAHAEADIRRELPQFSASRVLGSNFDSFHKNPAHQRNLLASLSKTYETQIRIGGRTFRLVANPIVSERNERLGTVVEWADRTAEVAAEREVADIVQAAAQGDFARRMEVASKTGFFKLLGDSMNTLLQTSEVGLNDVVRMLTALAQGDLTPRITAEYHGTFGQLKDDSNKTAEQLKEIVQRIQESTDAINVASREIAAGNSDLSQRTEQQASSLEETASSMEELTSTVKQNAENARQANQLAKGASTIAVKGGEVVAEVVTTMDDINASSKKIVDIISVIDGIAFQTNILALNAAVEAARAGEQGRGFAVVAGEVRNLAQRSAAAAKEIKGLISDSVSKVENGSRLVEQAGATMTEIVDSVKRVTDIMSEIAAASVEQGSGIEQVNLAITQMDEVTQQNAALVEEAAAAAESLEEQAQTLAQLVSVFKLDQNALVARGGPARTVAPSRASRPAARPAAKSTRARPAALPAKAGDEWEEF